MSQTVWKGFLNLGLLSIPIKLYGAAREERIGLNQLHRPCNSRIKMPRSCPTCNREVKNDEIVNAYEYSKGRYVTVTEEEMEALAPVSNHLMEIEATVKGAEVDPVYFGDSYYVVPEPAGAQAYTLLAQALGKAKLGALARLSRRQRERVMVIRPFGKGLLCHALHYGAEVRQVAEFGVVAEAAVTPQEVTLATKLLGSLEGPFEPENYADGYQARRAELLDKKQKGETVTATPAPTPRAPAVDMLAALQASLDAAVSKRGRAAVQ
jgi:DNA end-binding protein Ku